MIIGAAVDSTNTGCWLFIDYCFGCSFIIAAPFNPYIMGSLSGPLGFFIRAGSGLKSRSPASIWSSRWGQTSFKNPTLDCSIDFEGRCSLWSLGSCCNRKCRCLWSCQRCFLNRILSATWFRPFRFPGWCRILGCTGRPNWISGCSSHRSAFIWWWWLHLYFAGPARFCTEEPVLLSFVRS